MERVNGGQNGGQIYAKIYGKIYGKFYGKTTTHLGGKIQKIVRNRERCSKFEIGFFRFAYIEMCGSLLENGRFGGRGGRGAGWGLAGWPSELKNVGTKRSYTPPLGGKKTQAFLVAPQKGSFVGWLVI